MRCGIIKLLTRSFKYHFFEEGWRTYSSLDSCAPVLVGFAKNENWHRKFCADPFLFRYKGDNWLFYETTTRNGREGKGVIGCMKERDGTWIQIGKVLEEDWHLSHPQVIKLDHHIYMIPEASNKGKGNVPVYEALDFPFEWRRVAVLIDKPFADCTILENDGHWYMACYTIPPYEGAELWHAESFWGPWRRHPQWRNINQSRRLMRCGGAYLRDNGQLYRVAQDCNGAYGKRLFKIPVLKITPDEYEEGRASILLDCTMGIKRFKHTYNELNFSGHKLSVYDVHWNVPRDCMNLYREFTATVCRKLHLKR